MATSTNTILIQDVRVSYLYCFEPFRGTDKKTGQSLPPNYCVHPLIPPNHPQLAAIRTLEEQVAKAGWPGLLPDGRQKWEVQLQTLRATNRQAIKEGSIIKPMEEAYGGMYFLSANNKKPVLVVYPSPKKPDGTANVIPATDPNRPQSGDYCNVHVQMYALTKGDGAPRICVQLMGVQLVRKGPPLGGGRSSSADEFPICASEADAPAPMSMDDAGGLI